MSYHVYSNWAWTDEINNEVVDAVADGLNRNKWAGRYTPPCFALLTIGDMILVNLAAIIDKAAEQEVSITEETLREAIPDKFEYKEKAVEVCKRILIKLELFEKVLAKAEELSQEELCEKAVENYPLPNREDFIDHFEEQAKAIKKLRKEEAERN